jgi:hypothetical protein
MNPSPATRKPYGVNRWPRLSAPVDPLDNVHIARAQSILRAEFGYVDNLTASQARDIVSWHRPQH